MTGRAYTVAALTAIVLGTIFLTASFTSVRGQEQDQDKSPWIHIRVDEGGEKAAKVNVNLPLSLIEVAIDVAPDDVMEHGRVELGHHDISVADMRRLWAELKKAGDGEFVTVEEHDQKVHIRREGDYIKIDVEEIEVDEPDESGEAAEPKSHRVHVEVPVTVVDALLSGEGEELNVKNALSQLKHERGEIVRVEDGETSVRIWIDEGR